ncbi:HNH endonuclease signature motif containing protein [Streptomyces niveus]|uniref:HNH endonuclease signature motif containing protein n=1 Tax=Streptomyces niveus TaxID=193462 RepID=UPI0033BC9406
MRYTREALQEAARATTDLDDALRWCGRTPTLGSRRYAREKMTEWGIDTSHFTSGRVRHTEERLRAAVAESTSIKAVLKQLGINPVGGNHSHISRRIVALGIDTTHFNRKRRQPKRPKESPLLLRTPEHGRVPGSRLRRELLRIGTPESCAMCGIGTVWNGQPLSLEVDHINGDWWDNRAPNLRLLCPNCHAVTDTYRGRKRRTTA